MESSRSVGAKGSRGYLTPAQSLSGRYELLGRIGSGGMAEVYLARAVGLEGFEFEKIVVLKRVLPERMDDRRYAAMFRDEARVAATLEHPNIVHTHDIGIKDDECFFTMEYLHGEDLKAILGAATKAREHLPLELAMQIAVGCAAGLHHAHDQTDYAGRPLDIVHRDVSPSNIIVTRQSGVKLIDFGIAKATSDKEQTDVGVLKGKVAYMSPEQCRGEALDRRCDIFALGIVLYEMVTMERPFKANNMLGTVHKLLAEEPPPPSSVRPDCPAALERIVLKALEKDRTRRYQSAFEMQEELELVTRDCQLHALPGALGRYLEHLFGVKLHPWRQHVKLPPAVPRWAWTELDSTVTNQHSRRDAPMPKLPQATVPGEPGGPGPKPGLQRTPIPEAHAATPRDRAVITAQMPMASSPGSGPTQTPTGMHAPVESRPPTGAYVPVQFDNTYATESASELGLRPPPHTEAQRRGALRYLLVGGLVGAAVALAGLSLYLRAEPTSGPALELGAAATSRSEAREPTTTVIVPALPVAVAGPAPAALPLGSEVASEVVPPSDTAGTTNAHATAPAPPAATPPDAPSPDDDAGSSARAARLVERARQHLVTNPKQAYRDAKAAYDQHPSQTALQLMGHAACRMPHEGKALFAYRRLRGKAQRELRVSCVQLGLDLE